jgi:hypothetical protein
LVSLRLDVTSGGGMAAARALPLGPVTMFDPYVRGTRLPFRL